jgi:hypothetical protein
MKEVQMSAATLPLRIESTEASEDVSGLLSEHAAIAAEMCRLSAVVNKPRAAAEAALAEIDEELAALNDSECDRRSS